MKTNQDIAPRLWKLAESATTFSAKDTLKEAACEIETMREEIARLLDENNAYKSDIEAANARWEETASDGTDYTLTHSDGIYAVADAGGHVLCEFMRGATENGGQNEQS